MCWLVFGEPGLRLGRMGNGYEKSEFIIIINSILLCLLSQTFSS